MIMAMQREKRNDINKFMANKETFSHYTHTHEVSQISLNFCCLLVVFFQKLRVRHVVCPNTIIVIMHLIKL